MCAGAGISADAGTSDDAGTSAEIKLSVKSSDLKSISANGSFLSFLPFSQDSCPIFPCG